MVLVVEIKINTSPKKAALIILTLHLFQPTHLLVKILLSLPVQRHRGVTFDALIGFLEQVEILALIEVSCEIVQNHKMLHGCFEVIVELLVQLVGLWIETAWVVLLDEYDSVACLPQIAFVDVESLRSVAVLAEKLDDLFQVSAIILRKLLGAVAFAVRAETALAL